MIANNNTIAAKIKKFMVNHYKTRKVYLTFGKNFANPTSRSKHSKLAFLSRAVGGISRNILLISKQHRATAVSRSRPDSKFFLR
jgi:hypothetical protein